MFIGTFIRLMHPVFILMWMAGGMMILDHINSTDISAYGRKGVWNMFSLPLTLMIVGGLASSWLMFVHHGANEDGSDGKLMRVITVLTGYLSAAFLALLGVCAIILGLFMLGSVGYVAPLLIILAGLITLPPVLVRDLWT